MGPRKILLMFFVLLIQNCTAQYRKRRFGDNDLSNEVFIEEFETIPGVRGFRRIDYIVESNQVPETIDWSIAPSKVIKELPHKLRKDGYDPYFTDDLLLRVPSKSIYGSRLVDVTLDQGVILGMSDFRNHIEDMKSGSKHSFHLLLTWNRLRVHYRTTVDRDGLKTVGEMDMYVGRLFMDVLVQGSDNMTPRIQMSKVTDVTTKLTDLDALSDDFKTSISVEAEFRVKHFFNRKVLNILLKYMEEVLNTSSEENTISSFYSPLL